MFFGPNVGLFDSIDVIDIDAVGRVLEDWTIPQRPKTDQKPT
jgi:hypothetical protein